MEATAPARHVIPSMAARRHRLRRALTALSACAILPAVALVSGTARCATPIGEISRIEVRATGQGPEAEACSRFRPDAAQVREFLERAIVISGRQEHGFFNHGPCWARGTLTNAFDHWEWEMRDMGTGLVRATNGEVILLGDPAKRVALEDDGS